MFTDRCVFVVVVVVVVAGRLLVLSIIHMIAKFIYFAQFSIVNSAFTPAVFVCPIQNALSRELPLTACKSVFSHLKSLTNNLG